ncbi:MAG: hypothetical protein ACYS9T_10885 [Planctomycetota bacterium]|jgi:hypothetical protein
MNLKAAEAMIGKLSQRDKRALKIGAISVAAMLVLVFATTWLGHWGQVRKSLRAKREKLKAISMSESKRTGMMTIVPVFEMPQEEEKQKFLFRDKVNEQLKKAGIKDEILQFLRTEKSRQEGGYKLLRLQCRRGKCNFGQALDLLAGLKENPYLVGIEEFRIECNPEKRQEFRLDLTVSAFAK